MHVSATTAPAASESILCIHLPANVAYVAQTQRSRHTSALHARPIDASGREVKAAASVAREADINVEAAANLESHDTSALAGEVAV